MPEEIQPEIRLSSSAPSVSPTKTSPHPDPDPGAGDQVHVDRTQVNAVRVRHLYDQDDIGFVAGVLALAVTAAVLILRDVSTWVVLWSCAGFGLLGLRLAMAQQAHRQLSGFDATWRLWERRHEAMSAAQGAFWAVGVMSFYRAEEPVQATLLSLMPLGLSAGAVATSAAGKRSVLFFLALAGGSVVVRLIASAAPDSLFAASFAIVMLYVLLATSFRLHRTLVAFIETAQMRAQLVQSLTETHAASTELNRELRAEVMERRRAEQQLRRSTRLFNAMAEASPSGIWQCDAQARLSYLNGRARQLLSANDKDLLQRPWYAPFAEADRRRLAEGFRGALNARRTLKAEVELPGSDSSEAHWLLIQWAPLIDDGGVVSGAVGTLTDITDSKAREADLARRATTDDLTGLSNRRHFWDLAGREFSRARRYGRSLAVLAADLDHFKQVNDTHGHAVGDEVLRAFAVRAEASLREADVIGRTGGEEFMVLLPETTLEGARGAAERLREAICSSAFDTSAGHLPVTISVGGAMVDFETEAEVDVAAQRADRALYAAKAAGRNRVAMDEDRDQDQGV